MSRWGDEIRKDGIEDNKRETALRMIRNDEPNDKIALYTGLDLA